MLPKGHYFQDQRRNEQIVLFIRRHWMSFLPSAVFILLLFAVFVVGFMFLRSELFSEFPKHNQIQLILSLSGFFMIILGIFLTLWIRWYLNVVIVTPEHMVDIRQNELFNRKVSEQSLLRVQDVSAHVRGLFQTFFRYGTVYVETAGEAPNFTIPDIPNPNQVVSNILKLHEELVRAGNFEEQDMAEGIGLEGHNNRASQAAKYDAPKDKQVNISGKIQKDLDSNSVINDRIESLYRPLNQNQPSKEKKEFEKYNGSGANSSTSINKKQTFNPKYINNIPKKDSPKQFVEKKPVEKKYELPKKTASINETLEGELKDGQLIQL